MNEWMPIDGQSGRISTYTRLYINSAINHRTF